MSVRGAVLVRDLPPRALQHALPEPRELVPRGVQRREQPARGLAGPRGQARVAAVEEARAPVRQLAQAGEGLGVLRRVRLHELPHVCVAQRRGVGQRGARVGRERAGQRHAAGAARAQLRGERRGGGVHRG